MGQCGSSLASEPPAAAAVAAARPAGSPRKKGECKRGSGSKTLFHLEVDAGSKAAEARAAATAAAAEGGQPDSPAIAAAPASQSEGHEVTASTEPQEHPSSALASGGMRARRLSIPDAAVPEGPAADSSGVQRDSSSGSDGSSVGKAAAHSGSSDGSSGAAPALPVALSAQPSLPEAHPLPQRHVRFDQSPVKTHRYEVAEEEQAPREEQRLAAVAAAAAAAAAADGPSASSGCCASSGGGAHAGRFPFSPPSPTKSLLSLELQQRQRGAPGSPAGRMGSPSRAAALARVPMKDLLHSVASLSRSGREPTHRKQNQDNCFAFSQYCRPNQALLAALDGHGPQGHTVSGFLKQQLPLVLADHLGESRRASVACCCPAASLDASFTSVASAASLASVSTACSVAGGGIGASNASSRGSGCAACQGEAAAASSDPAAALTAAFLQTDDGLYQSGTNVQYSGSTAVVCMLRGRRLTTAWVGDSKAVLARQDPRGCKAIPLTRDHKPNHPDEKARIAAAGGRVERLVDHRGMPVGPDRVWLSSSWVPGLAMSRALGDAVAHSVGVTSEPETSVVEVCPQDKFLILATDGVWEFIDPQMAVDIVCDCKDAEEACRLLVDTAWSKWLVEEEGVVDDITVVCAKLNP